MSAPVSDPVDSLVLDLLEWIGPQAKPYQEVIEAWRTSCPRLPVWEEAHARGLIERHQLQGCESMISVSAQGARLVAERRQSLALAAVSNAGVCRSPTK